jgi:hypothetical protein
MIQMHRTLEINQASKKQAFKKRNLTSFCKRPKRMKVKLSSFKPTREVSSKEKNRISSGRTKWMQNLNYPIEARKNTEVAVISPIKVRLILVRILMLENSLKCQITPTQPPERPRKGLAHSFLISRKTTRI